VKLTMPKTVMQKRAIFDETVMLEMVMVYMEVHEKVIVIVVAMM